MCVRARDTITVPKKIAPPPVLEAMCKMDTKYQKVLLCHVRQPKHQ